MSVIDESSEVIVSTGEAGGLDPERRRRLRRRRRALVSPILLIALVLLVPAGLRAVRGLRKVPEPHAFAKYTGSNSGFDGPGQPGKRYTFSLVPGPLPDVTMHSANAILSKDSVAAAVTVSICRATSDQSAGISAAVDDLSEFCATVNPVNGQNLGQLGQNDSLIVTLIPLVKGRVQVTGVDLTYDQRGREATDHVDADFKVDGAP